MREEKRFYIVCAPCSTLGPTAMYPRDPRKFMDTASSSRKPVPTTIIHRIKRHNYLSAQQASLALLSQEIQTPFPSGSTHTDARLSGTLEI